MKREDIERIALSLDEAERTRTQIGIISQYYPESTLDDAYAIQTAWLEMKKRDGRKVIGQKIGLTSRAMQQALGIDVPDSGTLFDDMAFSDGATIPGDRFIQPRVEVEIAFVMKAPLEGASLTVSDVIDATDYIVPAIEILDTRVVRSDPETGATRRIFDTIADNAANAGIVTGGQPTPPTDIDMRWIGAILSRNSEVEETGLGAGVLDHPAAGIAWLAKRLAAYGGRLEAGEIVLSGSFIRPVEARHGDSIVADFGAFGTVSCHFE